MRLFVAITFSADIKAALARTISRLREAGVSGRFAEPENLHLTLVFIGETGRAADIRESLTLIRSAPFSLTLNGLGTFSKKEGDILWAGVEADDALWELQRQLADILRGQRFPVRDAPYRPHVTLARKASLPESPDPALLSEAVPALSVPVQKISLMESKRIDGRLVYPEIWHRPL